MNVVERMMKTLQSFLMKRSVLTKKINALTKKIATATDRAIPVREDNPLDFADDVIVATLNPAIPFIDAGGQLIMSEDHTAHRHEYTIRLIVDFSKP